MFRYRMIFTLSGILLLGPPFGPLLTTVHNRLSLDSRAIPRSDASKILKREDPKGRQATIQGFGTLPILGAQPRYVCEGEPQRNPRGRLVCRYGSWVKAGLAERLRRSMRSLRVFGSAWSQSP